MIQHTNLTKKPVIGNVVKPLLPEQLTSSLWSRLTINDEFRKLVVENQAIPIGIMPDKYEYHSDLSDVMEPMTDEEYDDLVQVLQTVDGIILQGGLTSDTYEVEIARYAICHNIPMIGICAGFNNIARAVDLPLVVKQDLSGIHNVYCVDYRHPIFVHSDHPYAYLFAAEDDFQVNSLHTMFLETNEANNRISVLAEDMEHHIEAFTVNCTKFCLAVKWHPEIMDNLASKRLFELFISACKR